MIVPAEEMEKYIGQEVGVSDWFEINQDRINQFAEGTNDHQFIHVDEEMAKHSMGNYNSSWIPDIEYDNLSADNTVMPENTQMAIN